METLCVDGHREMCCSHLCWGLSRNTFVLPEVQAVHVVTPAQLTQSNHSGHGKLITLPNQVKVSLKLYNQCILKKTFKTFKSHYKYML